MFSREEFADLFTKGNEAFARGHMHLALVCFERCAGMERSPAVCSALGICLAEARQEYAAAEELLREALRQEPAEPLHAMRLGRVLVLSGRRKEALETLRAALQHGRNEEVIAMLDLLGRRRAPLFKGLPRSHPVNRWMGKLLTGLGQ